jgi:ADP-heptose:LPS heptosyltransferase
MKIDLQRQIDRVVGQMICAILSLFSRARKPCRTNDMSERILVIMLSEMGSLVLAQPMFARIRQTHPQARIYALLFERNRECLELFDSVSPKNIFTVNGDSLSALIRDSIRALIRIRGQKIDTIIDCELFSRISSIFSFLSGAKIRVGFHPYTQEGLYRGSFINRPVLYNPYHHISKQFVTLALAVTPALNGMPTVKRNTQGDNHVLPQVAPSREAIEMLRGRLMQDFPGIEGKEMVLLYPGGGLLPIRAWPADNFCAVAEDLLKNGYCVGIIGLREDHEIARRITSYLKSPACFDLTGYTRSVRELITLFHLASLLITNDGGPGHFASLTPISTIILFGPETPVLYGPLGKNAVSLHVPLSCSPCLTAYNHRNSPCDGDNVCLKAIPPERVLSKAYELMEGSGRKYLM